jgi:NO-binding membrane sensor protein with MHYT domain
MSEVHHFSYGLWTPLLAYIMSCTGALLGLLLTARARAASGRSRGLWLFLGALSIGGTGIWVMHFIAMLGFSIPNATIRYDVPLTLLSAVIAVAVVGVGLFTVGFGETRPSTLLVGGSITGVGVASMHYTGMAAMNATAHVGYNLGVVALSVLIAVVAATTALWFTLRVRGPLATALATLIMGVAVSGMHYTGMAAMRVRVEPGLAQPSGAPPVDFLLPLIIAISVLAMVLLTIVAMSPNEAEMRLDAELVERIRQRQDAPANGIAHEHEPTRPGYGQPYQTPQYQGQRYRGQRKGQPYQGQPYLEQPMHRQRSGSARAGRWFGGRDPEDRR